MRTPDPRTRASASRIASKSFDSLARLIQRTPKNANGHAVAPGWNEPCKARRTTRRAP
jgi:hypothetical protein